jgi:hypothetical protein
MDTWGRSGHSKVGRDHKGDSRNQLRQSQSGERSWERMIEVEVSSDRVHWGCQRPWVTLTGPEDVGGKPYGPEGCVKEFGQIETTVWRTQLDSRGEETGGSPAVACSKGRCV